MEGDGGAGGVLVNQQPRAQYKQDGAGYGAGGGSYRDGISGVVALFIMKDEINFA